MNVKNKMYCITLLILFFITDCSNSSGNLSNKSNNLSKGSTIIDKKGSIDIIQTSFLFFMDAKNKGFFLYPANNMNVISNHFPIELLPDDVVQCGVMSSKSKNKNMVIQAVISKKIREDVSYIQNICSGVNSTLQISSDEETKNVSLKELQKFPDFSTKRFIFPIVPYYYSDTKSLITQEIDLGKLSLAISFYNRYSKKTVTNCTHHLLKKNNGLEEISPKCYAVPIIFPTKSFYAKTWESRHLHMIKSTIEDN